MKNVGHHLTRVVVVLVAIATADLAGAAYNFVDLNYEGTAFTLIQVFGTNDKGLVAGLAGFADGPDVGWVYDPKTQTFTDLPPLSGYPLSAMGINDSGVIAGSCDIAPDLQEGFILKKGTYTRFAHPGFNHTLVRGIGKTGLVTGYATNDLDGAFVGFIYDPARGTFTDIAFPDMYNWITAQGITAVGRAVGHVFLPPDYVYQGSPEGSYGFVREPSGPVTLFRVNGQPTKARGINDSGVIAGFIDLADGSSVGFVGRLPSLGGFQTMTDVELIAVPFTGATTTVIEAIDNSGRVVGQWSDVSNPYHGFIATPARKGGK
jgi:hypothetical protein